MRQTYEGPGARAGAAGAGNRFLEQKALSNSTNDNPAPERRMRLESFKPMRKGSLLGFACVRLPNGLTIADIPVCTSHGKSWASLPSKPVLDADGRHMADANGKKRYAPILQWSDRLTADRWSAAVCELVRQHHPDALDDGALR